MSETQEQLSGPVMICATRIIKPPPARVGKLGSTITLPRTVSVKALVAGGIGGGVGVILGAVFGTFQTVLIGMLIGAFLGVMSVSWSPVKGESFIQWLGVLVRGRARQKRLTYQGDNVAVYMGVARLYRVAQGPTHIKAGAVSVNPDQVDERGVLRAAHNRNEAPLRPIMRERPTFTPVYQQDLPDHMKRQTGSGARVDGRSADALRMAGVDPRAMDSHPQGAARPSIPAGSGGPHGTGAALPPNLPPTSPSTRPPGATR